VRLETTPLQKRQRGMPNGPQKDRREVALESENEETWRRFCSGKNEVGSAKKRLASATSEKNKKTERSQRRDSNIEKNIGRHRAGDQIEEGRI